MSDEFELSETTVEDILRSNPNAIRFFLDWKLACAGCGFARFCTLRSVSQTYKLDEAKFLQEVQKLTAQKQFTWSTK